MKILHVVPSYLPAYRYGGPILSVHSLNKWLVRAGVEVTVFTTDIDGPNRLEMPLREAVDLDGVQVWYFPVSFPVRWSYSGELRRALEERVHEFDLVHITSVFLAASTVAARAARKAGRPYVISPRGSLMREPLARKSAVLKRLYLALIERRNLAGAAAIHFTTEAEKKEYIEAGLPLKGSFVVPNGVDPEEFKERVTGKAFRSKWRIAPADQVVLSMGRIGWKKGFDTLVPAFAIVLKKNPRAMLVIDGADDAGYRAVVERMIDEQGIRDRVRFTGAFEGVDTGAVAAADCFVLPSYSENFGMAVVQAMYLQVPVVLTPGVALAEPIAKAGAGVTAEKEPTAFADAVLGVLRDPGTAKAMGARGRAFVEERFIAARVADSFKSNYHRLISHE